MFGFGFGLPPKELLATIAFEFEFIAIALVTAPPGAGCDCPLRFRLFKLEALDPVRKAGFAVVSRWPEFELLAAARWTRFGVAKWLMCADVEPSMLTEEVEGVRLTRCAASSGEAFVVERSATLLCCELFALLEPLEGLEFTGEEFMFRLRDD